MKKFASSLVLFYLRSLASLALYLNRPPTIIGIAGSVGKSSTRNAITTILQEIAPTEAIGNSETGIPLGVLGMKAEGYTKTDWLKMLLRAPLGIFSLKGIAYLVVEMGVDEPYPPKNMDYLLQIIQPDIAVITAESAAHTEQFEKIFSKKERDSFSPEEKLSFLIKAITAEDLKVTKTKQCKIIIYNNDNSYISSQLKKEENKTYISVGEDKTSDFVLSSYKLTEKGTSMAFHDTTGKTFQLTFPLLLPKEYGVVIGQAITTVLHCPLPEKYNSKETLALTILHSLMQKYRLPPGRGSIFQGIKNSLIIDSSYNASKVAVIAFLEMTKSLRQTTNRPVVFVFGDMRELGDEAKIEHQEVAKEIASVCDYLYCVGPLTKEYVLPIVDKAKLKEIKWLESNIAVGEYLAKNLPEDALVLIKGSQNTIFLEETVKYLLTNKKDEEKLCRQEPYWLSLKKRQGKLARI